jgi:hypothetical protein
LAASATRPPQRYEVQPGLLIAHEGRVEHRALVPAIGRHHREARASAGVSPGDGADGRRHAAVEAAAACISSRLFQSSGSATANPMP